jgi:hypothetical protein
MGAVREGVGFERPLPPPRPRLLLAGAERAAGLRAATARRAAGLLPRLVLGRVVAALALLELLPAAGRALAGAGLAPPPLTGGGEVLVSAAGGLEVAGAALGLALAAGRGVGVAMGSGWCGMTDGMAVFSRRAPRNR